MVYLIFSSIESKGIVLVFLSSSSNLFKSVFFSYFYMAIEQEQAHDF